MARLADAGMRYVRPRSSPEHGGFEAYAIEADPVDEPTATLANGWSDEDLN